MRHVQEKQVRSWFGGCKVNLQSLAYLPFLLPHPCELPNAFGPSEALGSLCRSPDSAPNTADSLRAPRPARAEPCRAPPSWAPSTFLASAGRCPPLATPETSPSSGGWGFYRALSPPLQITDSWNFKTSPLGEKGMALLAFTDLQRLQADATCTLLQRAIPQAPPPHPSGLHKLQKSPRPNYPWLRGVRQAEGASAKKAPGSSRTKIRPCQANGGNCLQAATPNHHGAA